MRAIGLLAGAAVTALALAACTGNGTSTVKSAGNEKSAGNDKAASGASASASAPSRAPRAAGPAVMITPGTGGANANPSKGITVTASGGKLTNVTVRTSGDPVAGTYSADHASWHSTWALNVSTSYTVTATAAAGGGAPVTKTSTFRTLTPSSTFTTKIFEGYGQTYGVGMPVILYFSQRITNKAAVERALQVTTSKPVIGSWYWDDSCGMAATCAYFRPRDYWPTGTTVSFTGHLDGVEGAPGVYGYHTLTQEFGIGQSVIAVGSTQTHSTQIYVDGKLTYNWAISTGRPGDDTPNGNYLTIEKENPVLMTGPGYSLEVPWSVRFTWSGDYYHDAYWSVGQQGFTNVSHGCVNLSPAHAETYYNMAVPGDPITIKGSPRGGTWDNGWTMWFLTWPQYLQGSALHEAVVAGPSGSTFADPATLPADTARAPLQTAPAGTASAA
jgi:lipoprotein-anchoring transpeptidase ErfK/SrfK